MFQPGNQHARKKITKATTFGMRLCQSDAETIIRAADKSGISRAEFMLRAALFAASSIVEDGAAPPFMRVHVHRPEAIDPFAALDMRRQKPAPMIPEFPAEIGGRKDKRLVLKVSSGEHESYRIAASAEGITVSAFIRRTVGEAIAAIMNRGRVVDRSAEGVF